MVQLDKFKVKNQQILYTIKDTTTYYCFIAGYFTLQRMHEKLQQHQLLF